MGPPASRRGAPRRRSPPPARPARWPRGPGGGARGGVVSRRSGGPSWRSARQGGRARAAATRAAATSPRRTRRRPPPPPVGSLGRLKPMVLPVCAYLRDWDGEGWGVFCVGSGQTFVDSMRVGVIGAGGVRFLRWKLFKLSHVNGCVRT